MWWTDCYGHLCIGCIEGTDALKDALRADPRLGTCRAESIAFCLEQMVREWEIATVGDRYSWYLFPYTEVGAAR